MDPISVALVHSASPRGDEARMIGPWSYDVPEFEVTHYPQRHKLFLLSRIKMAAAGHDVIVHEDSRNWGTYKRNSSIPVVYFVVDSTLTNDHYQNRLRYAQSEAVDMVLLDHDKLERFNIGKPVFQLPYCVNDKLFRNRRLKKTADIAFPCRRKGAPERGALHTHLIEFARERGYVYDGGIYAGEDYAKHMNRAKVVVNISRVPTARTHRTFDAMACRSAVLTSPLPDVLGEYRQEGAHYLTFTNYEQLDTQLIRLLDTSGPSDGWEGFAQRGFDLIRRYHTWAIRAGELHKLLKETVCK